LKLTPNLTHGANVTEVGHGAWTLEIPPGPKGRYRLAQIDDYAEKARPTFPWVSPLTLNLRARVSEPDFAGTWGFGFWNDPFSLSLGFGGGSRRFPSLPNAAWFFFASLQNHLSLYDDLPGSGFLAGTFRSHIWPPYFLAIGVPALPFLVWNPTGRLLRKLARRIIQQDAKQIDIEVTQWHHYTINWHLDSVKFFIDDRVILDTPIVPHSPLGFVLWIDNQYAALPPSGGLAYGTLPSDSTARLQIEDLQIKVS
jgi:hypothetical protein